MKGNRMRKPGGVFSPYFCLSSDTLTATMTRPQRARIPLWPSPVPAHHLKGSGEHPHARCRLDMSTCLVPSSR
jgi:hypothetical protein